MVFVGKYVSDVIVGLHVLFILLAYFAGQDLE